MAVRISTGLRNYVLDTGSWKGAFANCVGAAYSGPQPDSADAAETGTLLGYITLNGGAFTPGSATNGLNFDAAAAAGVLNKPTSAVWQLTGLAAAGSSGTNIGYIRLYDNTRTTGASTTAKRLDLSVSTSGANVNLGSTLIKTGQTLTIDSLPLNQPASAS